MRNRRMLCLWLPQWMLQRRCVDKPELNSSFLLITESTKRGRSIRSCNALAYQRGARSGMTLNEARSYIGKQDRLVLQPLEPDEDYQAIIKLALTCESFSYCIGIEQAEHPECILMDITGIAHFFADEQALGQKLNRMLCDRYDVRIAIGPTVGAAWAAAHFLAKPQEIAIIEDDDTTALAELPLVAMRLPPEVLLKLNQLGIEQIGQLRTLDRTALSRRMGSEVLLKLDQLSGRTYEHITPCHPPATYREAKQLEDSLTHGPSIESLYLYLLQRLLNQLRPRQLGVRSLAWTMHLEDRSIQTIQLRMCDCTADEQHIVDLLRLKWEQIQLRSPVIAMDMEAIEVEPLQVSQQAFFDTQSQEQTRQFAMLVNRFSSRLGESSVTQPKLLPNPIPEKSVQLCRSSEQSSSQPEAKPSRFYPLDRPSVLFAQPRSIEVFCIPSQGPPAVVLWKGHRFDVVSHVGPERIESGWFDGEYTRRDYYRIETESGNWMWIFRRLQNSEWFWHGEW